MKRFSAFIVLICFLITLTGCQNSNKTGASEIADEVTVTLPTDNSVNGYRVAEKDTSQMPDVISKEEISTEKLPQNNNNSNNYCANISSKIYHKSSCSSVAKIKDSNKYYADKSTLISKGFKPCRNCNP
ncbi:MAG: hypothetical protein IJD55_04085 [Clostridia bacterium]|nr:hypothetical protein [Clostridia bacterium]